MSKTIHLKVSANDRDLFSYSATPDAPTAVSVIDGAHVVLLDDIDVQTTRDGNNLIIKTATGESLFTVLDYYSKNGVQFTASPNSVALENYSANAQPSNQLSEPQHHVAKTTRNNSSDDDDDDDFGILPLLGGGAIALGAIGLASSGGTTTVSTPSVTPVAPPTPALPAPVAPTTTDTLLTMVSDDSSLTVKEYDALTGELTQTFDTVTINGCDIYSRQISYTTDGNILVLGTISPEDNNSMNDTDILLLRFTPDGQLDTTFNPKGQSSGQAGIVIDDYFDNSNFFYSVTEDQNGNIVVVGMTNHPTEGQTASIARYLPEGTLDTRFNATGEEPGVVVNTTLDGSYWLYGVAVNANNETITAGHLWNNNGRYLVLESYDSNGQLNMEFNDTGYVMLEMSGRNSSVDMTLTSDDKIIVSARSTDDTVMIARYTMDGHLDTSFNATGEGSGKAGIAISGALGVDTCDVFTLTNGQILSVTKDDENVYFARYNENGSLDTSFNATGEIPGVASVIFNNTHESLNFSNIAITEAGDTVLLGYTVSGESVAFSYHADGTINENFATHARVVNTAPELSATDTDNNSLLTADMLFEKNDDLSTPLLNGETYNYNGGDMNISTSVSTSLDLLI